MKHMEYPLKRIEAARRRERDARDRVRQAVAEAVAAGIRQDDVAQAAGISRVTLWRWLRER